MAEGSAGFPREGTDNLTFCGSYDVVSVAGEPHSPANRAGFSWQGELARVKG